MKKLVISLISTALLLFTVTSQGATIAINPIDQTVLPGFVAGANVVIQGLGNGAAPSLGAFDLDISYNPSVLAFNSASIGDPILGDQLNLSGSGSISGIDGGTLGVVNLFEVSFDLPVVLDSLQAGSFVLASLLFDPIAVGSSQLGITVFGVGDSLGNPLAVDLRSGNINVVPITGAVWLMGSGLVVLLGFMRRRKAFR